MSGREGHSTISTAAGFKSVMGSHRESADGDGEDVRKFFQPKLDPFFADERAFAQQESASHAAAGAMVPTGYGRVDEVRTSRCHQWTLVGWSMRFTQTGEIRKDCAACP